MLTAALLILDPHEATQIPFSGEQINKLPHPYNRVLVSCKKELLGHAWMNRQYIQ